MREQPRSLHGPPRIAGPLRALLPGYVLRIIWDHAGFHESVRYRGDHAHDGARRAWSSSRPGACGRRWFFGLAVEDLLGRPVDPIQSCAIKNPIVRAGINRSREVAYGS